MFLVISGGYLKIYKKTSMLTHNSRLDFILGLLALFILSAILFYT